MLSLTLYRDAEVAGGRAVTDRTPDVEVIPGREGPDMVFDHPGDAEHRQVDVRPERV